MMETIYLEKLKEEHRKQFILDNQYAFKYGAITELKENELDIDGPIWKCGIGSRPMSLGIICSRFWHGSPDILR